MKFINNLRKINKEIIVRCIVIALIIFLICIGVGIVIVNRNNGIIKKEQPVVINTGEADKELSVGTQVIEKNRTLSGKKATYKNPIIPVGFKAVEDGASWKILGDEIEGWNDGLVIEDEKGNQFVWVPVDNENVTYNKWCYDNNGFGIKYTETSGDELPEGVDENNQINIYGGFWIGRFEAGRNDIDMATGDTNDVSKDVELVIKKGTQPWNLITYNNAKIVAEEYIDNENVKSGLVTGTQWDTTMKWIENAGYDVITDSVEWGNYYNNEDVSVIGRYSNSPSNSQLWQTGEFRKEKSGVVFTGTGLYEGAKVKNIYDLAGNLWEWTTEKCFSHLAYRGGFAGDYSNSFPAGFRGSNNKDVAFCGIGFRVLLYLM